MLKRVITICFLLNIKWVAFAQLQSPNVLPISINDDNDFSGYELIKTKNVNLFALGEHWHNIKSVPKATLKLLKYLNQHADVTILAIEQGKSVAWMINNYLESGDETMLAHITRNTMFWAQEHRTFFKELRNYNLDLPAERKITVKSIDIEYKMESAVFVINQLIGENPVPDELSLTIKEFQRIYEETKKERESYEGIAFMYYYDRDFIQELISRTINDLEEKSQLYIDFFGASFTDFATMILEMDDGLTFDYTNPNQNYKFRDQLIYKNFVELVEEFPASGILCPIGMRHVERGSSIYNLKTRFNSPLKEQVSIIRISALYNKAINAGDLKRVNYNYPKQLKKNSATIIYHQDEDKFLRSKKYDYTIFINENGSLSPFEKVLTERY